LESLETLKEFENQVASFQAQFEKFNSQAFDHIDDQMATVTSEREKKELLHNQSITEPIPIQITSIH